MEFGRALTILQAPGRDAWVTAAWQTPSEGLQLGQLKTLLRTQSISSGQDGRQNGMG